jgi:F-type H+-transporting ATPase subunit epsilon
MPVTTLHVDIVSAEGSIFSGLAEIVFVPAIMGEMGILPRHSPLLTRFNAGEVRVKLPGGGEEDFFVSGGIVEVQPHMVTLLADTAVRARDLDEAAALETKRQAERELADRKADFDIALAETQLMQALAQLQTIQRLRKRQNNRN